MTALFIINSFMTAAGMAMAGYAVYRLGRTAKRLDDSERRSEDK